MIWADSRKPPRAGSDVRVRVVLGLAGLLLVSVVRVVVPAWGQVCCPGRSVLYANTYGVVCDGATDTTAALQDVLAQRQPAPQTTAGFVVAMPPGGQCKLTSTVTVDSVEGLVVQGNNVEFVWAGPAGVPMFVCRDCRQTVWEHFRIATHSGTPMSAGMRFENGAGTTVTPTANTVQFVGIECTNGGCTNGVEVAQGAGGDNNNEFNHFAHMNISNYTGSCFLIGHAQSKHNFLLHVGCSANGMGQHMVRVDPRGSFLCYQCAGGGHTVSDFYVANSTDYSVIRDSNFEDSAALLDTGGPSTGPYPFLIENVRWAATAIRPDNRVITYQYRGPLRIHGLFVEQGATLKPIEIWWNPLGGQGAFEATSNAIATSLANPFTFIQPTTALSNIRYDGTNWIPLADTNKMRLAATQSITAGGTITADACGGVKQVTASGIVTTSTTNTFDAPTVTNTGCRMDVCNTSGFAITLDANANFRTNDGNDVALAAASAALIKCVSVFQSGTTWIQLK
jgi:hypothetical protein